MTCPAPVPIKDLECLHAHHIHHTSSTPSCLVNNPARIASADIPPCSPSPRRSLVDSRVALDEQAICTLTCTEKVREVPWKCFSTAVPTLCAARNRSATSSGCRSRKRSTGRRGHTRTSAVRSVKVYSACFRDHFYQEVYTHRLWSPLAQGLNSQRLRNKRTNIYQPLNSKEFEESLQTSFIIL